MEHLYLDKTYEHPVFKKRGPDYDQNRLPVQEEIKNPTFSEKIQYVLQHTVDPLYWTSAKHIFQCSNYNKITKCEHGDSEHTQILKCHSKYCKCSSCVKFRRERAISRINMKEIKIDKDFFDKKSVSNKYKEIVKKDYDNGHRTFVKKRHLPERLYHFSFGSNILNKKGIELDMTKFMRLMRKGSTRDEIKQKVFRFRYNMRYIKVFDIGRTNFKKTGRYWLHFHVALFSERKGFTVRKFIEDSHRVLKMMDSKCLFNNIGYRPRGSIMVYFSRRVACEYGHKKTGYYYLPDLMNMQNYFRMYYRSRVLTESLPKRLIYSYVPVSTENSALTCPECGGNMLFDSISAISQNTDSTAGT